MKILVVFTGGTIGSTVQDGWISTDKSAKYTLIEKYKEKYGNSIDFSACEPYYLLSENSGAKNLNLLTECVADAVNRDYDGIIITHGTDSLHFTAAAVKCAFSGADMPIVFVSANYPLNDTRSNGDANFEGAVALIESGVRFGVYISYKNPDGQHFIHKAENALAFNETDDSIFSLNGKPFATYFGSKIERFEEPQKGADINPAPLCENPRILVVSTMPGDDFAYNISGYNAVILRPYHSGTLNNQNPLFIRFLENCQKQDIPVFLANAPMGTTYDTVKELSSIGIIPLPFTTFAYVYMKLWFAISQNKNLKNLF